MSKDPHLDDLQHKIDALKASKKSHFSENRGPKPMGKYLTAGIELVAGILVGVGLGLPLDWAFNTRPLFLIIFFLFGSAAGMLNVYRAISRQDKKSPHDEATGNKTGNKDHD